MKFPVSLWRQVLNDQKLIELTPTEEIQQNHLGELVSTADLSSDSHVWVDELDGSAGFGIFIKLMKIFRQNSKNFPGPLKKILKFQYSRNPKT